MHQVLCTPFCQDCDRSILGTTNLCKHGPSIKIRSLHYKDDLIHIECLPLFQAILSFPLFRLSSSFPDAISLRISLARSSDVIPYPFPSRTKPNILLEYSISPCVSCANLSLPVFHSLKWIIVSLEKDSMGYYNVRIISCHNHGSNDQ